MMSTELLETCRELKQIHRKELCVKLVIYRERTSYQLIMMTYSMVQYPYLFSAKIKQNKTK